MRLFLILFGVSIFISAPAQSLREIYSQGTKAYEAKNFTAFQKAMFRFDSLRPNYPVVVYNLAAAYALTGESDEAIATLKRYILMNNATKFWEDEDFSTLRDSDSFQKLQEWAILLSKPIDLTTVAMSVDLQKQHPEGITYSRKSDAFFVGMVRSGRISKTSSEMVQIWQENQPNAWAVMGLDISPNEKHLWACTAALPEFEAYADNDKGKSSILKYDLKTGKLLQTWVEPGDHVFGDLIVNKQGDVFVSDGTANKIYRIDRKKNELTEFLDCSEDIYNLQGLAFDRDESFLYVSDYITGIFRINMTAKDIEKVALPEDISPKGIDGLYWYKNRLLAIQNGTTPKRVWDLLLNEDGSEVTSITMVARGGKDLNEPTQGIIIEDQFYFLANSPWGSYDKKGNFNVDPSSATQIRKYDLEGNK